MFDTMKKIKKINREASSSAAREYDAEGREIIKIKVLNDDNFVSPYSHEDGVVISADVASFLDDQVKPKTLKTGLHVIVESDTIDSDEEELYRTAIKNYYGGRVIDLDRRMRTNALAAIMMTLIAVLIFSLYIILDVLSVGYVLLQLIDIAAWVFTWEAVDLFFLERSVLRYEQTRDIGLFSAAITFDKLTKKNADKCHIG